MADVAARMERAAATRGWNNSMDRKENPESQKTKSELGGRIVAYVFPTLRLIAIAWAVVGFVILIRPLTLHNTFVALNLELGSFRYYFPEDQSTVLRALASMGALSSAALLALSSLRDDGAQTVRALTLVVRLAAVLAWLVVWTERPGLIACGVMVAFESFVAMLLVVALRGVSRSRPSIRDASSS